MVFLAENEVTFPLCEIVQASLSSVLLASLITLAHKCVRVSFFELATDRQIELKKNVGINF